MNKNFSNQPFGSPEALSEGITGIEFLDNIVDKIVDKGNEIIDTGIQSGDTWVREQIGLEPPPRHIGQEPYPSPPNPGNPYDLDPNIPKQGTPNTGTPNTGTPSNGGAMDIIKNPIVLGGASMGVAKLAGMSWLYSGLIGAAGYFILPTVVNKIGV